MSRRFATRALLAGGLVSVVALAGALSWARRAPAATLAALEAPSSTVDDSAYGAYAGSIGPLRAAPAGDARRVALGRRLFFDARLSRDGSVSCASCHRFDRSGTDGLRVPVGIGGALGAVNTPTLFNADLNPKQFWDGRATDLESQIDGPLQNVTEMASTWPGVVTALRADGSYAAAFSTAYPQGITPATIKDAIATFERTLVTTDSPFDRYLAGDAKAIEPAAVEGYALFKSYGCVSCHQGRNVGGNLFEKMGVMGDYFADRGGEITETDLGRFNVTKRPADRFKFRVPSLRLASRTAPYFHDGRAETLERAIEVMGKYQVGADLGPRDVRAIAAFLTSLAGTEPRGELDAVH